MRYLHSLCHFRCQQQRIRMFFAALLTTLLQFSNPAQAQLNYQDLWWAGSQENGWGMSISQQGSVIFAVLYIYDASGRPQWVVMPGGAWNSANDMYTGALYVPTGTPFNAYDASRLQVGNTVGNATLRFQDSNNATLSYSINGVSGIKTIMRQQFGSGSPTNNYSDLWWGGQAQNGWGLSITQKGSALFAVWYTYDSAGRTSWYVMPGGSFTSNNVYSGDLYRTTGAPWIGTSHDPNKLQVTRVGTLTLTFSDAKNASMRATVDSTTINVPITRQSFSNAPLPSAPLASLVPLYVVPTGLPNDPLLVAARQGATVIITGDNTGSGGVCRATSQYPSTVNAMFSVGGKVAVYIYAKWGTRNVAEMLQDLAGYSCLAASSRDVIVFIDESSFTQEMLDMVREVRSESRRLGFGGRLILNPGAISSNPSASDATLQEAFLGQADVIVTFENTFQAYRDNFAAPPAWTTKYPPSRFAHLLHTTNAQQAREAVTLARARGAGVLGVTDQLGSGNTWGSPPSYIQDLSAILSGR
jgi:hypothetical protein